MTPPPPDSSDGSSPTSGPSGDTDTGASEEPDLGGSDAAPDSDESARALDSGADRELSPSPDRAAPVPDEPTDGNPRRLTLRIAGNVSAGVVSACATFYGGCALALLLYTWMFPLTTGVQLQRWLEADATYEKQYRPRSLADIDHDIPLAVVAAEDTRFFQHTGIDWTAIGEALEENRDGDADRRGGSSISQQLVKNLFLTTHSTYLRKALELPLTYMAEAILTKDRILELYVNVIEWGPGIYGAEAAARYHYDRSAAELTRYQAAALAACIPNPLVRRPYRMDRYTRIILQRMAQLQSIELLKQREEW